MSAVTSSTPRGVDELLQRNGKDLYNTDKTTPKKKSPSKSSPKKKTKSRKTSSKSQRENEVESSSSNNQDIISALLNKGNELRDALVRSEFSYPLNTQKKTPTASPIIYKSAMETTPKKVAPIEPAKSALKPHRSNLDLRFVDLMLGAEQQSFVSTPPLMSPVSSMLSEFEGNPLHDNTLLEQMFYNNDNVPSIPNYVPSYKPTLRNKENEVPQNPPMQKTYKVAEKPCEDVEVLTDDVFEQVENIECARVLIDTLHLTSLMHEEDNTIATGGRKGKMKKGRKPPMPSPRKKQGTYFIEYRFPATIEQRTHKTSTVTHNDITRLASRKTVQSGTVVIFDQHSVFPLEFDNSSLQRWMHEDLKFYIYYKKASDKKPSQLGHASIPLSSILQSHDFVYRSNAPIIDQELSIRSCGTIQVCIELTSNLKDISTHFSPQKKPNRNNVYAVTKNEVNDTTVSDGESCEVTHDITTKSDEDEAPWYHEFPALQLMVMLYEGKDIPGTTMYSSENGVTNQPPNTFLVCRSSFSQKKARTGVVWGETNPQFNFTQSHVVKLDDETLEKMQGGFIVVEVWMKMVKHQSDKLIGLVKAPMQMFFHKLCNQQSARACIESSYPVMAVDRFLPIVDVFSGQTRGQINMTLALGTQDQINLMKKLKLKLIENLRVDDHHLQHAVNDEDTLPLTTGPVQHSFKVEVVKIHGFKPSDNQVWGETDCFVQYSFPKQIVTDEENSDSNQNLASMQSYRTDTTLCVPNPAFNQTQIHVFCPPLHVPVHRFLMMAVSDAGNLSLSGNMGGIPFEVWSRFYYPNVRDQFIAKGWLPLAKLCALVTMTTNKTSQQTFVVPLDYTSADGQPSSAGQIEVKVTYTVSGTTMENMQPAAPFTKPCILKLAVERACGLKAAANLLADNEFSSEEMKHHAEVGVNCYATISPSFLPDQDVRTTRVISNTFSPEFQHHIELACPLVSYQQDITAISLAELLHTGQIEFKFYHKPGKSVDSTQNALGAAVMLGTVCLPLKPLLYKTTGLSGWFSIKSALSASQNQITVGAVELSVTFTTRNDLDLILRAAVSTGWKLPVNEARLLTSGNSDVIIDRGNNQCSTNHVTLSVTITNAWLPKHDIIMPGRQSIDRKANVYVRYKFYDADSVVSSLCPVYSTENNKSDKVVTGRIAHKQLFSCKITDPFMWYLREEKLAVQMWLTHSTASKLRPTDCDKLLGTCFIDLTDLIIGSLSKPQNISGVHELYMAGSDDLGGGCCRVYINMTPGTDDTLHNVDLPLSLPTRVPSSDPQDHDSENSSYEDKDDLDPNSFMATVTIERAMHLPLIPSDSTTKPNCYVSFQCVELYKNKHRSVNKATAIIKASSSPTWMSKQEVRIPKQCLGNVGMIFKLWHRDSSFIDEGVDAIIAESQSNVVSQETRSMANDIMLGFATIDLSVLTAGLLDINGWYNLLDLHGQCKGQIKIAITPHSIQEVREISQKVERARCGTKSESSKAYNNIHTSNFLHTAPISGPVQTPSGSLYYPGIPNSSRTVGVTCKMDELQNAFQKATSVPISLSTIPLFQASRSSANNSIAMHQTHAPTSSMIYYNNLDRNQQCLFQTLQKQIAELENIKSNFEQRRANDFVEEKEIKTAEPQEVADHSNASCTNDFKFPQPDEKFYQAQVLPQENQNLLKVQGLSGTAETLPSNSVHLSLYQDHQSEDVDQCDDQFSDGLLSDDDKTSDIELIEPQSLNASVNFDQCLSPEHPESCKFDLDANKQVDDVTHCTPQRSESPKYLLQTPHLSECPSALEDTSVWMTSTSRISELSEDEERGREEGIVETSHHDSENDEIHSDDKTEKVGKVEANSNEECDVTEAEQNSEVNKIPIPETSSSHHSQAQSTSDKENSISDENEESNEEKSDTPMPSQGRESSNQHTENEILEPTKNEEIIISSGSEQESSTEETASDEASKSNLQFFPPIKDLESQMRAVQAVTTEHKHKLTQERNQPSKEEVSSSPSPRSKRFPAAKENLRFSSEQTQRLQRIFKTKFSNK